MKSRATIICLRTGKVLLVRRKGGKWNFPGGGIKDGEKPLDAAVRELGEEACLRDHLLHGLCTVRVGPTLHYVFTLSLPEGKKAIPGREIVACKWVHRNQLSGASLNTTGAALLGTMLPILSSW